MSTQSLGRHTVIPAQTNVDPARIIGCVLAAEGTVIREFLGFVAHPARSVIRRSRGRPNVRFCRWGARLRLEPQDAAKSTVHLVHEGCGRVADRFFKVGLIEGDEGGDVDD